MNRQIFVDSSCSPIREYLITVTESSPKMKEDICNWLNEVNFAEPGSTNYNIAMVMICIMFLPEWNFNSLLNTTRLQAWELKFILKNLTKHQVLIGSKIDIESEPDGRLEFIVELSLICLLISGKVVRTKEKLLA